MLGVLFLFKISEKLVKCKPFKISRKLSFYYNNWPCALLIYAFFPNLHIANSFLLPRDI